MMKQSATTLNGLKQSPLRLPMPKKQSLAIVPQPKGSSLRPKSYGDFMQGLDGCRSEYGTLEGDYRKKLNDILANLYGYAQDLMQHKEWWVKFCQDGFWQGRQPSPGGNKIALRYVIKWACGATRDGQKSSSLYYRALKDFWKEGRDRGSIASEISRRGGIRKLAEMNSEKRRPAKEVSAVTAQVVARPKSLINAKSSGTKMEEYTHNIVAMFKDGGKNWACLKNKGRAMLEVTIDDMSGNAAHITVDNVTVL